MLMTIVWKWGYMTSNPQNKYYTTLTLYLVKMLLLINGTVLSIGMGSLWF